jgi:hypothetical protein
MLVGWGELDSTVLGWPEEPIHPATLKVLSRDFLSYVKKNQSDRVPTEIRFADFPAPARGFFSTWHVATFSINKLARSHSTR